MIYRNKLLAYNNTDTESQQAEKLLSLIKLTLKQANTNLQDVDLISVAAGPGSFTGVRIGLATALGMQLVSNSRFISLSNFQILAWQQRNVTKNINILIEAKKNEFYYQKFTPSLIPLIKPTIIIEDEILEYIHQDDLIIKECYSKTNVNALNLALASEYFLKNNLHLLLEPLYIREALTKSAVSV